MDLAPSALVKLQSDKLNGDASKLTKKEICSLSFRYFGVLHKDSNPKPLLVSGLQGLVQAQPDVLVAAAAALAAAAAVDAPPQAPTATALPVGAAAADVESDSDGEYEPAGGRVALTRFRPVIFILELAFLRIEITRAAISIGL